MKLLDTSAIIRSDLNFSEGIYFITGKVLQELRDENIKFMVNSAIKKGNIKIADPREDSIQTVVDSAAETGDIKTLSETDIEIIATALEKDLIIVTDDYAIQNVAAKLNLNYETLVQEGIKQKVKWINVCEGCNKKYPPEVRGICSVCGSRLLRKRSYKS